MFINPPNCGNFQFIQLEHCMIGKVEFVTGVIGSSFVGLGLQCPAIFRMLDTHHSIQMTHVSFVVSSCLTFGLFPILSIFVRKFDQSSKFWESPSQCIASQQ